MKLKRKTARKKNAIVGATIVILVALSALLAPWLTPYQPQAQNLNQVLSAPSKTHLLGTDFYGRDVFTRLIYGARISLLIGLVTTLFAILIGIMIGLLAGYLGTWADRILMRLVDVLLAFPRMFIMLLVVGLGRPSLQTTIFVLVIFSWMEVARITRAEVMAVKESLYVKSAVALGLKPFRVLFSFILPNVSTPIIVSATLMIGSMILLEAGLSFLGLGVQPPTASWGTLLKQGRLDPVGAWWLSLFAGLAIVMTVIGLNLLGDGLQDYLDPRAKKSAGNGRKAAK